MKSYILEALVKDAKGSTGPFKLSVSKPKQAPTGEYACRVDCPFLFSNIKAIRGVDADQVMALALWLVDDQLRLGGYSLVDAHGILITLPIDRNAGVPSHINTDKISD